MFLGFHGLAKDGLAAAILFFHGASGCFHVAKCPRLHCRGVGDDFRRGRIDLQQRAAAGTGNFDRGRTFRHFANDTAKSDKKSSALKLDGENAEHAQQFPSQEKDRQENDNDRHQLSEGKTATVRLKTSSGQAEDIQSGKSEDYSPENVVHVSASAGMTLHQHHSRGQERLDPHTVAQ
jgi:hypothetical protein